MTIAFPNPSRNYDPAKGYVRFWGSDSAREVSFNVDRAVLQKMSSTDLQDEAAILRAFDANRARIQEVASNVYGRQRLTYHHLRVADF